MKKISLILILIMIFGLCGCSLEKGPDTGDDSGTETDTNPEVDPDVLYDDFFNIENELQLDIDIEQSELLKIEEDYQNYSSKGSKSPIYRKCNLTITVDGVEYYYEEVGIRMKGNTSRNSFFSLRDGIFALIHFKFSFSETFDDKEYYSNPKTWEPEAREERKNRTFAGMEKLDIKWNKCYDATHLKEFYTYKIYEVYDILAPKQNLCTVNIKNKGSMQSLGVYMVNENVDKIFIERRLSKEQQGGDLYKVGWGFGGGGDLTSTNGIGIEDEDISYFPTYDLKTNKKTSNHSSLITMINSLQTDNFENYIDMDYYLKYMAINYLLGLPDDIRFHYNNYCIYFLKDTGKAIFIPYDNDHCLGITKDWNALNDGMTKNNPYTLETTGLGDQANPLMLKTVCYGADSKYLNKYRDNILSIVESKWFKLETFKSYFDIAKANYQDNVVPTVKTVKYNYIGFNINESTSLDRTDVNISIGIYFNKIKETVAKYAK